tara:strand:+ start:333 stop:596 length:264 start_codon:yes stop_codon:yes gene_type:complete
MKGFKIDGKTAFGKWVSTYCNQNQIKPRQLYDHTGIKARTMQRILKGRTVLSDVDLFWIIGSLADLTGDDPVELGEHVVRLYLLKHK